MSILSDNDPIWQSISHIHKDILGHGMSDDGRLSISSFELMWLLNLLIQLRYKENLFGTIATHINVLYGSEIRVPSYLVFQNVGISTVKGNYSFNPVEDGTDDWVIKIDIQDISEEGTAIED